MNFTRRLHRNAQRRQSVAQKQVKRLQQVAALVADLGRQVSEKLREHGICRMTNELLSTLEARGLDMQAFARECGLTLTRVEATGTTPAWWEFTRTGGMVPA